MSQPSVWPPAPAPRTKPPGVPGASFGLRYDVQPHSSRAIVLDNMHADVTLEEVERLVSSYGAVRMVNIEFVPPPPTMPTVASRSTRRRPSASASSSTSPSIFRARRSTAGSSMLGLSPTSSRSSSSNGDNSSPMLLTPVLTLESDSGEVRILSGPGRGHRALGPGTDVVDDDARDQGLWSTFSKLMGGLSLTGRRGRSSSTSSTEPPPREPPGYTANPAFNIRSTAVPPLPTIRDPSNVAIVPVAPDEDPDPSERSTGFSASDPGKSIAYIYFETHLQASKALDCLQVTFMRDRSGRTAKWDKVPIW